MEYVISDAIAGGADTMVTVGGLQSNHMRQVAASGNRFGLKVWKYSTHQLYNSRN
jgi:1-aminocyclopropane-1-carboxylate deaminase